MDGRSSGASAAAVMCSECGALSRVDQSISTACRGCGSVGRAPSSIQQDEDDDESDDGLWTFVDFPAEMGDGSKESHVPEWVPQGESSVEDNLPGMRSRQGSGASIASLVRFGFSRFAVRSSRPPARALPGAGVGGGVGGGGRGGTRRRTWPSPLSLIPTVSPFHKQPGSHVAAVRVGRPNIRESVHVPLCVCVCARARALLFN
jgi:hypothetical protein